MLKLGIEWLYPFTDAYRMSFKAYLYYLEGMLLSPCSVEAILQDAIETAEARAAEFEEEEKNRDIQDG